MEQNNKGHKTFPEDVDVNQIFAAAARKVGTRMGTMEAGRPPFGGLKVCGCRLQISRQMRSDCVGQQKLPRHPLKNAASSCAVSGIETLMLSRAEYAVRQMSLR